MRRIAQGLMTALMALLIALPAFALDLGTPLKDPAAEARARALFGELRCMVCQNESIGESNAQLAADLRQLVREHIAAGESDDQIKEYLVARYGEFVLLKPPLELRTLLLWGTPLLVLTLGALGAVVALRRRPIPAISTTSLTEAETAELDALIAEDER